MSVILASAVNHLLGFGWVDQGITKLQIVISKSLPLNYFFITVWMYSQVKC